MTIDINVYHHGTGESQQLSRIELQLAALTSKLENFMATTQEQLDALTAATIELKAAVAPLADAINVMEAKITAALAGVGLTDAQKAQIDAAIAEVKSMAAGVAAAVADAGDNVDEGAVPGPGPA